MQKQNSDSASSRVEQEFVRFYRYDDTKRSHTFFAALDWAVLTIGLIRSCPKSYARKIIKPFPYNGFP